VQDKSELMKKLGQKELVISLCHPLKEIVQSLSCFNLRLAEDGMQLVLSYDPTKEINQIANLLDKLKEMDIKYNDIWTRQSSLEEIFLRLVGIS
jgi:ABC-2 type transport system ATP-binding protein